MPVRTEKLIEILTELRDDKQGDVDQLDFNIARSNRPDYVRRLRMKRAYEQEKLDKYVLALEIAGEN